MNCDSARVFRFFAQIQNLAASLENHPLLVGIAESFVQATELNHFHCEE
jgi:hypothetical protein